MEKNGKKLFLYGVVIFLLLSGLTSIAFSGGECLLKLELLGLIVVLIFSFLGLLAYNSWGERVLFFVFLMCLINLLLVWGFFGSLYLVLMILALLGLVLSMPERKDSKLSLEPALPVPEPVREAPEQLEKKTEIKSKSEMMKSETKKSEVKFTPGKYVASKRSNIYHEPKCDWAKKIKKDRRLWFSDKKEAQGKGYRKHSCIK